MKNSSHVYSIEEIIMRNRSVFFALLVILICVISFTGLTGSLQNLDECLYANIARETLEKGSVIPLKEGQYYLHKSPMMFWSTILSFRVFGVNDFGAKFPSAFANAVSSIFIFFISLKLFKSRVAGILSTFIYLTSIQVYGSSHQLATDSLMVMSLLATLFFGIKGVDDNKYWLLLAAFFNGMTFLIKSIMGLILPATLLLLILIERRWDIIPFFLLYLLMSIAMSAPYFFIVYRKAPELFVQTFLRANILGRFYRRGGVQLKTIVSILLAGLQYILFLLLFLLPFSPGLFYLFFRKTEARPVGDMLWGKTSRILSIYFLIVLIGFSISSANGVWTHYTLPMIPAVSLFLGYTLSEIQNRKIFLLLGVISLLVGAGVLGIYLMIHRKYPTYLDMIIGLTAACALFSMCNILLYYSKTELRIGILAAVGTYFIAFTIFTAVTVPLDFNADIKSFGKLVYDKPSPVVVINTKEVNEGRNKRRAVYWYLKMNASEHRTLEDFLAQQDSVKKGSYLIYYKAYNAQLRSHFPSLAVLKAGRIWNLGVIE
jgi:4-amino-4-deoxy-L-arabinose transferase-like glycosyltransferase